MKLNYVSVLLISCSMTLSSCCNSQFNTILSSSSVGGMFGSSIGGIINGPRGADKGTIAGMVIGGAIGAAVTTHNNAKKQHSSTNQQSTTRSSNDDVYDYDNSNVQFDTYNSDTYKKVAAAATSDLACLEVTNVKFLDANNNRKLDNDEKAFIVFDIYNRSNKTLYNVTPNITCNSSRVAISSAASVASVLPGQGIRYKATIVPIKKLKERPLQFTISFGSGKQRVVAKTFSI